MINFWRVMRMALRHRVRYGLAVFFALAGALFFGGNIAAALPLLKVLLKDQTLHAYLDQRIADQRAEVIRLEIKLELIDKAKGNPEGAETLDDGDEPEADRRHAKYEVNNGE